MSNTEPHFMTDNIALSSNWYRKDYLKNDHHVICSSCTGKKPAASFAGFQILFIREGSGTAIINGRSYRLEPGSCFMLAFFHIYTLEADAGNELKYYLCQIPYRSFMFVTNTSAAVFHILNAPLDIPHTKFTEEEYYRYNELLSDMKTACDTGSHDEQYSYLFELFARVRRKALLDPECTEWSAHQ